MTANTSTDDRRATAGPGWSAFDRYRFETTTDGEALVYDVETAAAWIQSTVAVTLEDSR